MGVPKYYATYCVMDEKAGANPLWHAFLVLLTQKSPQAPIQVIDAVGFYSQPTTTTNPVLKGLKHMLGFRVDLQDGHGVLQQEKMRELDGDGLRGITFEATPEQFSHLQVLYKEKMAQEKEAINELNHYLKKQGAAANGVTRHVTEKTLAALDARAVRLHPFHIALDITKKGLDSSASHACKNYVLGLLLKTNIINETTHHKITGGATKHAFPRFGNMDLSPLRLVSTGEPTKEISHRSGKVFYNRGWEKNKLFLASALHTHHTKPSKNEFAEIQHQYRLIKKILTQVREVELTLLHKMDELTNLPDSTYKQTLEVQLQRVQNLYLVFSVSPQNRDSNRLSAKLLQAEATLDVARMSLTPHKINYPFMLRAYESIAIRNALLCLMALSIGAIFITNPLGIALITTATVVAGHQLHRFFKEETQFAKMHANYSAFQGAQGKSEVVNAKDHSTGEQFIPRSMM